MEYTEMKDFLKEQNITDIEMQEMWDFCISKGHPLICQLNRSGKNWSDLNTKALSTLRREYLKLKNTVTEGD